MALTQKQNNQRSFEFCADAHDAGARPFLKWAGGKTSLLSALRKFSPIKFKNYIEPFVGGGAFFFDLSPTTAILSDSNAELIHCYKIVRDSPGELIAALRKYRVSEDEFYRIRALEPNDLDPIDRAARFIYLNKTCFNGLYRVNRQGRFNTPYGKHKSVKLADESNLYAASSALKKAKLYCFDYQKLLDKYASGNDFVYLDPPYLPVSAYSDFKRYTSSQFYESDHATLAKLYRELDKRGCYVLLSNSYHPKVFELYSGFNIKTVTAPRFINCKGSSRGNIKEIIVTNYDI